MHQQIWENCLNLVKHEIQEQSFKTWFLPITPIKLDKSVLTIQVPSQFFYEWLEDNYVHILRKAILQELGPSGRLEYSVVIDRGNEQAKPLTVNYPVNKAPGRFGQNHVGNGQNVQQSPAVTPEFLTLTGKLNPIYVFDSYIEGDCNRLARSAGYAVAQRPGVTSFNPLMIYGGVGLGKTHLVQAVGNQIMESNPDAKVLYVASEKFTNQFIESLRNNAVQDFINFYQKVDVLIIDDVQFLRDKERTQEIFFHIFNHLHQSGKQIIMTSDCPPRELKGLQERLVSRFKWGLTADIQTPDFETRVAIIQKKTQAEGIIIPEDVLEYLAYTIDSNIRELEGVMISLIAHSSLVKREIDLELAKQIIKNIVNDYDTEVGIDYIQKAVSDYFNVALEDLKAKTRKKEIVIARQVAMYFSKDYTNHSLKSIGYHFGGRDHSTVIHAVQAVNDMIDTDAKFRYSVDELKKRLKMRTV
ncbi:MULTISPECIES: chromosomal replication initiator protein DnaA [unclassified Imperialibacter]|uniref:chromosomal replication initiator protein DnaA n=1 Tax=unclassified Imperialibacter TaxID=2629706 RepID=UPI0012526469|nr:MULTISPECIES: chromosomal replication initiator protein DnaA [unclassified Imperialibacter]CAD5273176.1 Chromosomal replication initiator protein DnaA [Imperialibacter sp. 89]CAD5288848.1 Chromosomal replication initiator protein DnaA [Imperialibacter sp. 75]VVT14430.1 Chromosomal replication initiator protein DnaA [Imperialibacter sp. EC-SDR9]